MNLCSDFFGDFHVKEIELTDHHYVQFWKQKASIQNAVCSQQIGKYGKKWAFDFVQLHICFINEVRAKLTENINIHMEPFEENNLIFKIVYFCFYQ